MRLRAEIATDLLSWLLQAMRHAWQEAPTGVVVITYALYGVVGVLLCVLALTLASQDNAASRRRWAEGPRRSPGRFVVKSLPALTVPVLGFLLLWFLGR
jgi:hypothetical protein